MPGPVKILLEHGADPTIPDRSGRTALDIAATRNDPVLVRLLAQH